MADRTAISTASPSPGLLVVAGKLAAALAYFPGDFLLERFPTVQPPIFLGVAHPLLKIISRRLPKRPRRRSTQCSRHVPPVDSVRKILVQQGLHASIKRMEVSPRAGVPNRKVNKFDEMVCQRKIENSFPE